MVDMPWSTWLSAGLVFVAVALGTVALALFWEWAQDRRRKREALRQLRLIVNEGVEGARAASTRLFRSGRDDAEWVASLAARMPRLRDIELLLEQAGLKWTLQTYLTLSVGFAIGFGLLVLTVSLLWYAGVIAAAIGGALPYLYVRSKRKRRFRKFEEQLPEAIDLMGRAIRAGHPLSAGFGMVAAESPEPVATEFRRTFEEQRFGLAVEDSLMGVADRVDLVDVRILVTAVLIQRNVGGNLAEILDTIAYTIRERFKIRRQLRVYTAQGRMGGYVLAVLPIAVGAIIFMLNPKYMMTLFTDPAGRFALTTGITLQVLGYLWIRKIVNIDI